MFSYHIGSIQNSYSSCYSTICMFYSLCSQEMANMPVHYKILTLSVREESKLVSNLQLSVHFNHIAKWFDLCFAVSPESKNYNGQIPACNLHMHYLNCVTSHSRLLLTNKATVASIGTCLLSGSTHAL